MPSGRVLSSSCSASSRVALCFLKMAPVLKALMALGCLIFSAPGASTRGPRPIVKHPGEDCELQCWGPDDSEVQLLEWTRADLQDYVFLYREGRVLIRHQHPSFSNRVQLRDPQLKSGDLSVVLKRVTTQDSGTYLCLALFETSGGIQEISEYIDLTVTEPGEEQSEHGTPEKTEERAYNKDVIPAIIFVLLCVLLVLIYNIIKHKTNTKQGWSHH